MSGVTPERTEEKRSRAPADRGGGGRILVVEDDAGTRELLGDMLREAGHEVSQAADGQTALRTLEADPFDVVLLDLHLPVVSGMSVLSALPALNTDACFVVMTAFGSVDSAVEAMRLGAYDYIRKPFREEELLLLVDRARETVRLRRELAKARRVSTEGAFRGMVGRSPAMRHLFGTLERVATTRATVLIEGETGTGKELVAHAIHDLSPRARRPFTPVNCSALPDTLLESELFGHEKGAFTGAVQSRRGWIEEAAGGTLFLDEVSTLNEDIQVKLLRVLQERAIHRIGSRTPIPVDFRLVVATNRDLRELVRRGRFREDLFYRLDVFPLRVPPLRERKDDIALLAHHFRARFAEEYDVEPPGISPGTLSRMVAYDWPGNVRELENFIERSVILHPGADTIVFDHIRGAQGGGAGVVTEALRAQPWTLDRLEREYILSILERARWHQGTAADILGINRRTIYRKLKRYREEGHLPQVEADAGGGEEAGPAARGHSVRA